MITKRLKDDLMTVAFQSKRGEGIFLKIKVYSE
jgi:hypothetical protein